MHLGISVRFFPYFFSHYRCNLDNVSQFSKLPFCVEDQNGICPQSSSCYYIIGTPVAKCTSTGRINFDLVYATRNTLFRLIGNNQFPSSPSSVLICVKTRPKHQDLSSLIIGSSTTGSQLSVASLHAVPCESFEHSPFSDH